MTLRNHIAPKPAAAATTYQKTTLDNGIRVITEEIPSVRSASVGIWIDTGSRNETAENNGISHFIEHMMFKGTKKRSYLDIAQSLESVGGYMNAFTTKEHTCYYARVLDEHVENAVDVLADMVQHSLFPKKEIEKERTVVLEEIKRSEDDPDDLVHEYFDEHLFGTHPFARPIIGTAGNIRRFTQDDLFAYTERFYVSGNMVLTVAGNVKHDRIVRLAAKYLTAKPKRGDRKGSFRVPKQKRSGREYPKPIQQAHLLTGTLAFDVHDSLRYPGLVLNAVLGDGMSSRLFQQIREKHGLAYSVYSFLSLTNETGAFGIYAGTDKATVGDALELGYRELEKVKKTRIPPRELSRAKAQLKGSMLMSLESTSNRMMRLGNGELYFGEYRPLDTIVRNIDAVTADDVIRTARRLFDTKNFTTVVVTPEEQPS
ncbi:MAG: insulinase family protein [Bacteroidetes bacterium]|nr:MAG: insulinase family protein [Bacteroidota bacterium]